MTDLQPSGTFQRVTEYLRKKQESEPSAPESRPYVIAISRQHGARGSEIAEEIGRRLDWQVYDRNLVDEITGDPELQGKLSTTLDERHKSWIVECFEAFTGATGLSDAAYVHRLVRALLSLAARGECVIVGRGAGFRLPPETTFRVALVAPLKDRVGNIAQEQQSSESEAASQVKKVDHDRHAFVKDHFHKDPREMEHYDLVLNTSTFSTADCARLVIDAYRAASQ